MSPAAIVLYGCGLFGASALAQMALQQSALVAAVAGAVIAELGGGKVGVAWNDPKAAPATASRNVRQGGLAVGLGVLAAAVALGLGLATGTMHQEMHGRPLLIPLALGLVECFFYAIQTEILQRGLLRVFCMRTEPKLFVPLAILVGLAATAGRVGLQPGPLLAAAASSLALALAWNRAGGALVPICLHTGQRFVLTALASGSGLGLVGGGLVGGSPLDTGVAAAAGMLALAAALAFWRKPASQQADRIEQKAL